MERTACEMVKRMMRADETSYQNGERIYQTMVRYQQLITCWGRQKKLAPVLVKYYAYTVGEQVKATALRLREI